MRLTEWFPDGVKPARPGVYETRLKGDINQWFQYWNGEYFGFSGGSTLDAYKNRSSKSIFSHIEWRGLAEDPKGSKK
jgi:hypothetical protein